MSDVELDPKAKYTFINNLPGWEEAKGCHCHPEYTYHDADFQFEQRLTLDRLVDHLVQAKLSERYDEMTIHFFDEKFVSEPDSYADTSDTEYESYIAYRAHRDLLEKTVWDRVNASALIVKAKREADAKDLAAKAAEAERIRQSKWKVDEQERKDREDYARLQKKFTKEDK